MTASHGLGHQQEKWAVVISGTGGVKPGSVLELERRLYRHLIIGKLKSSSSADELDRELESMAFKLDIERAAVLERLERQQQAREVYLAVSRQLIDTIMDEVSMSLMDSEQLFEDARLSESQLMLLEQLCAESPDLGRLRLLISGNSWLCRDLGNLVNSPSFRQRHPQRSDVRLTDLKLVLNFIGVENLRQLAPYYCLRNWLPAGHSCLLWTNRKLLHYALMCATAAKALAKLHERNEALAYIAALLSQFGTTVVLGHAAAIYEKIWGNWLREANATRDKELYDAVMATEFPGERVLEQVLDHSNRLSWEIPVKFGFAEHTLVQLLKSLDETLTISELPLDAQIQAKAACYARVMILADSRQLEPQEARLMYSYYGLSEQEILRLKAQNYRRMELI